MAHKSSEWRMDMGSYIGIGLVAVNAEELSQLISVLFNHYRKYISKVIYKYPKNEENTDWVTENVLFDGYDILLKQSLFLKNSSAFINLHIGSINIDGVIVSYNKRYNGILIEVCESDVYSIMSVDDFEHFLIHEMRKALNMGFIASFCDNEATFGDSDYSVFMIREEERIKIKYASWKIDGYTARKK